MFWISKWRLRKIDNFVSSASFWRGFAIGGLIFWVKISLKDVMVGILDRNDLPNYLKILDKLLIWDCRRNKSVPKFNLFLHEVKAMQETERLIA